MSTILKTRIYFLLIPILLVTAYYFSLPKVLFTDPYSTVLEASNGELLSASIARDGQWRFPEGDTIAGKFKEAMITFEDKRFQSHPGVDIRAIARAFRQNLKAGKIVSGGSTISMQLIRLSRKEKSRTWFEKCIEIILATRLELRYTKDEILSMYAAHAPFGGNVVGVEAACWRYFGIDPQNLSWAEAATLAVLPNSPSLMHPGKNRELLRQKRDRLLNKLKDSGKIDAFTCSLAKEEQIPVEPAFLPRHARHLMNRIMKDGLGQHKVTSTIDFQLQVRIEQILKEHHERLKANQILNASAIVMDVRTGNVISYIGNVDDPKIPGSEVDVVGSPRSTGSILKPFLYAAALDAGKMLPKSLLPDIPIMVRGFAPKNFSRQFDGAVPADKALIRSLNIPAVHSLMDYRYEKFHGLLKEIGMTTLSQGPDHYGLSLILGGAEGTLWDITGMYASMARTLNNFFEHPGKNRYNRKDFHSPNYLQAQFTDEVRLDETSWLSAASIYLLFDALKEVYRPGEETGWRYFNSGRQIAWKTGTSFGFRDGWAIGVTPEYAVGVWVGNASGEGRPGLTGTETAAPVMFDIFSQLPGSKWFIQPKMEMHQIITCHNSGYRISDRCEKQDTIWTIRENAATPACPFHKTVHLTSNLKFQLHSECASVGIMKHIPWFVLPPVQEYYFKQKNNLYRPLPPFRKDCQSTLSIVAMDMIYPKPDAKIFIPRDIDGKPGMSVFQLAHRNPNTTVYWHLDGVYVGSTRKSHHLSFNPSEGAHILTLVDEDGESIDRHFAVIPKL